MNAGNGKEPVLRMVMVLSHMKKVFLMQPIELLGLFIMGQSLKDCKLCTSAIILLAVTHVT